MLSKSTKVVLKNLILFITFGLIYYGIESIFKYPKLSHWTMAVVGGFCALLIGFINEYIPWEMEVWKQCLFGSFIITSFEGVSGIILNVWLHLNIWDYSNMMFSFCWGQCCLPFCAAWFVLSGVAIFLDDYLRWKWFGEEYPHYKWI